MGIVEIIFNLGVEITSSITGIIVGFLISRYHYKKGTVDVIKLQQDMINTITKKIHKLYREEQRPSKKEILELIDEVPLFVPIEKRSKNK